MHAWTHVRTYQQRRWSGCSGSWRSWTRSATGCRRRWTSRRRRRRRYVYYGRLVGFFPITRIHNLSLPSTTAYRRHQLPHPQTQAARERARLARQQRRLEEDLEAARARAKEAAEQLAGKEREGRVLRERVEGLQFEAGACV